MLESDILLDIKNQIEYDRFSYGSSLMEATYLSSVKVNMIKKVRAQLPVSFDNRLKGTLLFLLTPNLQSSINTMDSKTVLLNTTYTGYYFNWIIRDKFGMKMKRLRFKYQDRWIDVKTKCSKITRTFKDINKYYRYNMFYDLSDLNTLFFNNLFMTKIKNVNNYMAMLNKYTNPDLFPEYSNFYYMIPINDWVNGKTTKSNMSGDKLFKDFRRMHNPITYLSWIMKTNPTMIRQLPKIVVYNDSSWFVFDHSVIEDKKLYNTFKTLCKRLSPDILIGEGDSPEEIRNNEGNDEPVPNSAVEVDNEVPIDTSSMDDTVKPVTMDFNKDIEKIEKDINPINLTGIAKQKVENPTIIDKTINDNHDKEIKSVDSSNDTKKDTKKAIAISVKNAIKDAIAIPKSNINDELLENEDEDKNEVYDEDEEIELDEEKEAEKELQDEIDKELNGTVVEDEEEIIKELNKNDKITAVVRKLQSKQLEASPARLAREKKLKEKFKSSTFNNKSIEDLIKHSEQMKIDIKPIKIDNVIDTNLGSNSLENFEESYVTKQKDKDLVDMVNFFSEDIKIPMAPLDVKLTKSSNDYNITDELNIVFEDRKGKRHNIKLDLPKIEAGKMYIGGSQKSLFKQIILKPIVKTEPDTVQITTDYNKLFIRRVGTNISNRLSKTISIVKENKNNTLTYKLGDFSKTNAQYVSTIFFDELSKIFYIIENKEYKFIFDLRESELLFKTKMKEIKLPKADCICIGKTNKDNRLILLDAYNDKIYLNDEDTGLGFMDFFDKSVIGEIDNSLKNYKTMSGYGKMVHSEVKIMGKNVPLVLLCIYSMGLNKILERAKIKYRLVPKSEKLQTNQNEDMIEFNDVYLVYETIPLEDAMLINGLKFVPTYNYNIGDMEELKTYIEIFELMYDRGNIALAFDNFYELMIDPTTKKILEDLDLPNNYIDVLLYSSALLVDNSFKSDTDLNVCRLKSANEIINTIVYSTIANAYARYKLTATNNNPIPMTVKRDAVIQEIMALKTSEEYSEINPMHEVERARSVSYKGFRGINLEQSHTLERRCMTPSMTGSIAASSVPSGKTGVVKQLCMDASIVSTRGYFKPPEDVNKLTTKNLMSPSEGLVPFSLNHDNAPRLGMMTTQQHHTIPVADTDVFPISNGTDKIMTELVSDVYCYKAKGSGKILNIDEELGIMELQYDDGKYDVVNIKPTPARNSGGGFYVVNELTPKLKIGQSFSAKDILAYNDNFFKKDIFGNPSFTSMVLCNVGLMSSGNTYDDSIIITERLAKRLASDVVMMKSVVFAPNTNIIQMVKEGDKILVGDPLITFEENPTDDDDMGDLMDTLGKELGDDAHSIGKSIIKSNYEGTIEKIKIYYTSKDEDLSDSAKKMIRKYNGKVKAINDKLLMSSNNNSIATRSMMIENTKAVPDKNNKVKGVTLPDGIMIEFYIKYKDIVAIGDKLTLYTALKGVVSEVIPEGKEIKTVNGEIVDLLLSHISVDARMVTSLLISGFLTKVMVKLKERMKEIWES